MSQHQLCCKCHKFYATADKLLMCSLCYKQHEKTEQLQNQIKKVDVDNLPVPKQLDHTRCYLCNKKIGLLGFNCKKCECSYCNMHRLPQDHKCSINFIEDGKKQMQKKNPLIIPAKIQQI